MASSLFMNLSYNCLIKETYKSKSFFLTTVISINCHSVVRPAVVYGLETVAVTKKQVEEMEVAEMKMLRFAMGVTRIDKLRNEYIRSTVMVEQLEMKMRGQDEVVWTCHKETKST